MSVLPSDSVVRSSPVVVKSLSMGSTANSSISKGGVVISTVVVAVPAGPVMIISRDVWVTIATGI